MDFFEAQDSARRRTGLLVLFFVPTVILITIALYFAAILIYLATRLWADDFRMESFSWWIPELAVSLGMVMVFLVSITILNKFQQLREGGSAVANMLGGVPLLPSTADSTERRLLNVVEEMAIASGLPTPRVWVMRNEQGINAYAAGWGPDDAVIGITQGALDHLDRDELQAVVAHEFSHILHGDMRLNIVLIGVLDGIQCIAVLGKRMFSIGFSDERHSRGRIFIGRGRGGGTVILIYFLAASLLALIGSLGLFGGRLIKSAVSRQREFLADAAAVQFTRNRPALVGVLRKIGGIRGKGYLRAGQAEVTSHMTIAQSVATWRDWLATHPPLVERIKRLDPLFDGTFEPIEPRPLNLREKAAEEKPEPARPAEIPFLLDTEKLLAAHGKGLPFVIAPLLVMSQVGRPGPAHFAYARKLREQLPEPLKQAARDPFAARALIYGLLLDPDPAVRERQMRALMEHADEAVLRELGAISTEIAALRPHHRLPLVDMTLRTLEQLSPAQYEAFDHNLKRLIRADDQVSLLEFMLGNVVTRHLDTLFRDAYMRTRYATLEEMRAPCLRLLSAMAHQGGSKKPEPAARSFAMGVGRLQLANRIGFEFLPREQCGFDKLTADLLELRKLGLRHRKRLIEACATTVTADGRVRVEEAELLRATADALGCPMPPLLPGELLGAGLGDQDADSGGGARVAPQ